MSVTFDVAGCVGILTIDRPERRNAVDRRMSQTIADAMSELDLRDDLSVGIITGAGGIFSAGMDLKALTATGERPLVEGRGAFGLVENPPTKPLIAAVEGFALGGGFEIALACDLIVAGRSAQFGLPEVKRGLAAAAGGVVRLPQRIALSIAMELILTGDPIDAERAAQLGLVNRVTADGDALMVALHLARAIGQNAPLALRLSKQVARAAQGSGFTDAFEAARPLMQIVRESQDAKEGTAAFVERRTPEWTNS